MAGRFDWFALGAKTWVIMDEREQKRYRPFFNMTQTIQYARLDWLRAGNKRTNCGDGHKGHDERTMLLWLVVVSGAA